MAAATQATSVPAFRMILKVRYALSGEESNIALFMIKISRPMRNRSIATYAIVLFPSK